MSTRILKTMERYQARSAYGACMVPRIGDPRPAAPLGMILAMLALAAIPLAGIPTRSAWASQGEVVSKAAPYQGSIEGIAPISYGWQPFPGFSANDCCSTCRNAWDGYCQEKQEACYRHAGHDCGNHCGLRCHVAQWLHPHGERCVSGACGAKGCCDSAADSCQAAPCGGHLFRLFGLLHGGCRDCGGCASGGCDTCGEPTTVDGPADEPSLPSAPGVPASDPSI